MTSQHENPSDKSKPTDPAARRGVQRRDWAVVAVVAVVAVIAIGLGVYLLVRPAASGNNTAADNPVLAAPAAPSRSSAVTGRSPVMSTHSSMGAAPPGMGMNPSTMAPSPSTGSTSGTSAPVLPAAPSDGAKATKIGPLGDLAHRITGDPLAQGSVNAPVVMVMFSDFRCPFCAEFSRTTEPVLVKKYVDTGILRIEWRDFPIFGTQSTAAAIAGRAAAAQGRFFQFTQAVYAVAPQTGHPDLSAADLVGFAQKAGVPNIAAFKAAMNSQVAAKAVAADLDQASGLVLQPYLWLVSAGPVVAVAGALLVSSSPG